MFTGNMDVETHRLVLRGSGYKLGKLPFRCLGVPITARSLNNTEYEVFTKKIISRIKIWGSRHLSYSARAVLVNSVLLSLHSYWARIFVLPKGVINDIIAVCRNFLWDGKVVSNRSPPMGWAQLCKSKREGGLGIDDCEKWNTAAFGKLVWDIANKTDSLWVKWINHTCLKGQDWKTYVPPLDVGWVWKKVCKVKDVFIQDYDGDVWDKHPTKMYTMKSGYDWLCDDTATAHWAKWAWNGINIPKHNFICWMVGLNKQ